MPPLVVIVVIVVIGKNGIFEHPLIPCGSRDCGMTKKNHAHQTVCFCTSNSMLLLPSVREKNGCQDAPHRVIFSSYRHAVPICGMVFFLPVVYVGTSNSMLLLIEWYAFAFCLLALRVRAHRGCNKKGFSARKMFAFRGRTERTTRTG